VMSAPPATWSRASSERLMSWSFMVESPDRPRGEGEGKLG
jgi:hypothetical protein